MHVTHRVHARHRLELAILLAVHEILAKRLLVLLELRKTAICDLIPLMSERIKIADGSFYTKVSRVLLSQDVLDFRSIVIAVVNDFSGH